MKKYGCRLFLSLIAVVASGCATIIGHSKYPVAINSQPTNAKVHVANEDGEIVFEGRTPTVVMLSSGESYFDKKSYIVNATKDGYAEAGAPIETSMNGWYWGNILLGGVIGLLIVDPITGAMYEINTSQVDIPLTPHNGALSTRQAITGMPQKEEAITTALNND